MAKVIRVNYHDVETKEFMPGISLYDIADNFKGKYNYPILAASVDNHIVSLTDQLTHSARIDFYDRSSGTGNAIYGRTLQFILVVAVKKVLGDNIDAIIHFSIDKGFYVEVNTDIDKDTVRKIDEKMHEISTNDYIINKVSVSRYDAIKYFKKKKQTDKVKVLKYISNTYVNLYRIDDVYDYFYGELAYRTSLIDDFKLTYIKDNGFVVSYPDVYNPECTLDYKHHEKLFNAFLNYSRWGESIGINNAADLNEVVSSGKYNELIRLAETHYNNQLAAIAEDVYQNKNKIKLVLIAGPSSSGKTTTSKKLETYLQSKGLKTHQISIDDYFFDRDKTPKLPNGELDTESLNAVDVTLFNKHLTKLFEGERVELPEYNFIAGKREYRGKNLELGENDIIIIEGLHALNDDLTICVDRVNKYKIYISALTQLNIDNHNRIHTSDTRKLRRIIRDNQYRCYGASETLKMWKTIREGEEKYVFPYQDDVNVILNSAHIYELGILKTYAEPLLFAVSETDPNYAEALRLINFLRNFLPIPSDYIPNDSILREFIGRSCFFK